jgi:hypothetical protein
MGKINLVFSLAVPPQKKIWRHAQRANSCEADKNTRIGGRTAGEIGVIEKKIRVDGRPSLHGG